MPSVYGTLHNILITFHIAPSLHFLLESYVKWLFHFLNHCGKYQIAVNSNQTASKGYKHVQKAFKNQNRRLQKQRSEKQQKEVAGEHINGVCASLGAVDLLQFSITSRPVTSLL